MEWAYIVSFWSVFSLGVGLVLAVVLFVWKHVFDRVLVELKIKQE